MDELVKTWRLAEINSMVNKALKAYLIQPSLHMWFHVTELRQLRDELEHVQKRRTHH
jgi:C4-dicarboxylate-specific signal transduction histidine kinase